MLYIPFFLFIESFIFALFMKNFLLYIVFWSLSFWFISHVCGFFSSVSHIEESSVHASMYEFASDESSCYCVPTHPSLPEAEVLGNCFSTQFVSLVRSSRFISEDFVLFLKTLIHRMSFHDGALSHELVKKSFQTSSLLHTDSPNDFYIFSLRRILI